MTNSLLTEQLKQLPASPGVYLLRDAVGNILYVGKAASLRHRVRSYFGRPQKLSVKLQRLMSRVNDLDFFVTGSEQEALILELNLIKRHHPYYNVRLKDDKSFPYLKINLNEDWPRVYVTRRLEENGGRYFGPFTSARSVRQTLKVLQGIFPFRACSRTITGNDRRPCLDYHLHHCLGPCIGAVSQPEYAEVVRQVILFLEGKQEKIVKSLKGKMEIAAEALDFEKAARLRDQIQAIERVIEGQRIATTVRGEQDVIAFAQDKDRAYVQVFLVRGGKLIGRESFVLQGTSSEEPRQIMSSFIKQFYSVTPYLPPLLLLQHPLDDKAVIERWLQSRRGAKIEIQVPYRGNKKQLVRIVAENAEQGLQQLKLRQSAAPSVLTEALAGVEKELDLPHFPERIEGYDISNIQGRAATGSMVVFEKGKPQPSHYRRFRIKTVSGADDYAMLQEVLRRRFKRSNLKSGSPPTLALGFTQKVHPEGLNSRAEATGGSTADTWKVLPDLVLIDGGRGQLNAARAVVEEMGVGLVPVASLAKENEEIFVPQRAEALNLPFSSPALQLLQRIRDEAHRFALGYHRTIRQKASLASVLDAVPGIGPRRKRALLQQFGSVPAIREASAEELATVKGISQSLAKKVKEYL